MTLTLRYMALSDIPQVVVIDRQAFTPPWSAQSYAYEINESTYSHMVVLEKSEAEKPTRGLRRLLQNLSGAPPPETQIVGYGGLWHIVDEAHISTIASHPAHRGRRFGEILLVGMLRRAATLGAAYIVLEVRVSNVIAQNLYLKYGFRTRMTRPRYYHSDGEDAFEMRLDLDTTAVQTQIHRQFAALQQTHQFVDNFSAVPPPRGQV